MIIYLIKLLIIQAVLYLFYKLLLEKSKAIKFNRFYFLFSILFSFASPFFGSLIRNNTPQMNFTNVIIPKTLNNTIAAGGKRVEILNSIPENAFNISLSNILLLLYCLISLILLFRYFRNLINIYKLVNGGEKVRLSNNCEVFLVDHKSAPFNFMNFVILNKQDFNNSLISNILIEHENGHRKQFHSIDILFIEMVIVFFWFIPLLYLFRKEIKLNHEYLADEYSVNITNDIKNYADKLIEYTGINKTFSFVNNMNYKFIKRRILMLSKGNNPRIFKTSIVLLLVLFPVLVFCSSFIYKTNIDERIPDPFSWSTVRNGHAYRINDSTFHYFGNVIYHTNSEITKITAERIKISNVNGKNNNYFENDFVKGFNYTDGVELFTYRLYLSDVITYNADRIVYSKDSLNIDLLGKAVVKGEDLKVESNRITLHLKEWKYNEK